MSTFRLFLVSLFLIAGVWLLGHPSPAAAQSAEVIVLEIDAPVTPPMLSYFERGVQDAEAAGAAALLVQLDTPGGGVNTTLEIVQLFRGAEVPVIVYVGPAGAQAASAGTIITLAGHAAGMAPETVIGAASPINMDGSDINETAQQKAIEDLTAVVRGLAERRGPDAVALAESTIVDATAVNSSEALEVGFIDAIAANRQDLLQQLDGMSVIVNQEEVILQTAGAAETLLPLTAVERVLLTLTNPTLISLLLTLAIPLILIELRAPGGYVAGFVGVLALGLALYGLGQIPVNWLGLGLLAVAGVLLFLETQSGTGFLAGLGVLTMIGGLLVLFNSNNTPDFVRLSIPAAIALGLLSGGIFIFIAVKALGAQRRQPLTGGEGLIGQTGRVRKQFVPDGSGYRGTILVAGELWQAESETELEKSSDVVVRERDGFRLQVEPKISENGT